MLVRGHVHCPLTARRGSGCFGGLRWQCSPVRTHRPRVSLRGARHCARLVHQSSDGGAGILMLIVQVRKRRPRGGVTYLKVTQPVSVETATVPQEVCLWHTLLRSNSFHLPRDLGPRCLISVKGAVCGVKWGAVSWPRPSRPFLPSTLPSKFISAQLSDWQLSLLSSYC